MVQVGFKFHDCDFFYNPCQAGPCFAQWTSMMKRLMMTMQSDYDNDEVVPHLDRLEAPNWSYYIYLPDMIDTVTKGLLI